MSKLRAWGWYWFSSGEKGRINWRKCGKWMYFFTDQDFAISMCEKAIEEGACYECKCSDLEKHSKKDGSGVICFYLNGDDIDNHKRIITFMLKNDLIKRTKSGRLYNASFKFDDQTMDGEYGSDFKAKIKLEQFVDLDTGEWIYNKPPIQSNE